MAFFQKFKNALGFGDEGVDYEDGIDATVTPLAERREYTAAQSQKPVDTIPEEPSEGNVAPPEPDESMRLRIFDRVVEIFNDSLPAFLKSTVDTDAQRRYLYDALDKSMKQYLDDVDAAAQGRQRDSWMRERQRLENETRDLRERVKQADEKSADYTRQHLSTDRQLRTLKERVHDLETQVANLEGENEQFQLENRSLVNRLRVCSVQVADDDMDYATKLQELTQKYEIAQTMINDLSAEASKAKNEANENADALNEARQELSKVKEQLTESLKPVEDPRVKEYAGTIDTLNMSIKELQEQLQASNTARVKAEEELQNTKVKLAEANDDLQALNELESVVTKFEEIKVAKDAQIKKLTTDNNQKAVLIESLKNEVTSLKLTIEANLDSQVSSEGKLKKEIEGLKADIERYKAIQFEEIPEEPAPEPQPEPKKKPSKRKAKISAIDDSIDEADWLVAPADPGKGIVVE
ncbi:MAG: hypothetical protein K2L93_08315, partial [Muribaculaceae bacterium]|nr:hypothetical protein [Muribaculaceae bacterium]